MGEEGHEKQLFCCKFTLCLLSVLGGAVVIKSDRFSRLPMKNVGFIFQMKFASPRCQRGWFSGGFFGFFCFSFISYFCEI